MTPMHGVCDFNDIRPQISGDNVVWYGYDGNDDEIFLYDGVATTQLTNNSVDDEFPQISGDNVVWQGDGEVFLYDGVTTTQLTNNSFPDGSSQVSGDNIVWMGYDGNDWEIFHYDGVTTTNISNNSFHDFDPQISGDNVVWQSGNSPAEILLYDGITTTQITNNSVHDTNPKISGDNVVWYGDDVSGNEVFLYDGVTTTQLTNNSFNDYAPQISGDNIVWMGHDGNDWEIFLFDGVTTTQLTSNSFDDSEAQISGDNVVWYGYDGSDQEIFMATPIVACDVGDADCDGDTDLDDVINAIGAFTGPCTVGVDCFGDPSNGGSVFDKTRADGDVNNGSPVTGDSPLQGDGDVDMDDIIDMVGAFTGPLDEENLMPASAGDVGLPDLIYDASTGEVFLDGTDIGGTLQAYNIKNAGGGILNGAFTPILGGAPATDLPTEIGEFQLSSTATPPGGLSIGLVFPAGMDFAQLSAFVTGGSAAPSFGGGSFAWELFAINVGPEVPEPSTYALAAIGLLGLGFFGWRRNRA